MTPDALSLYYCSSEVVADGGSLPQKTVSNDSTSKNEIYWSDPSGLDRTFAIGFFDNDTTTSDLRGVFFSVREASSALITTDQLLPVLPVTGDTFRIIQGILFSSDQKIPADFLNAEYPEVTDGVTLRSLTGVTVKSFSSEVDLYLKYDADSEGVVAVSIDNENWGLSLEVGGGDVVNGYLQTSTGEWLIVDIDVSELPSDSETELIMCSEGNGTLIPPVWLDSDDENRVLHHFAVLKNEGDSTDSEDITFKNTDTIGTAVLAADYNDGDLTISLTSIDELPGRDFWLHLNESEPDIRYVTKRAGNLCYLADTSGWQEVYFKTGIQIPTMGSTITQDGTNYTGILRAMYVTSGSFAAGDAEGIMVLSDCSDLFSDSIFDPFLRDELGIPGIVARTNRNTYWGIRGIERITLWDSGDSVQFYPAYDVWKLTPDSVDEFEISEGTEYLVYAAPVIWTAGVDEYSSDSVTAFSSGDVVGVVLRRYLLEEMMGNLQIDQTFNFDWD